MQRTEVTCWTLIRHAAAGEATHRETFARRYEPVARAYLEARWRGSPFRGEIDDAIQEVFLDCFRGGGVLERVDPERSGGFRAFFFGVVRTAALKVESRRARRCDQPASDPDLDRFRGYEEALSQTFDQAWARMVLKDALERQRKGARLLGERGIRRVELLRRRVYDGLPIREIAREWKADSTVLHREYARARREFRVALKEALAFESPGREVITENDLAELIRLAAAGSGPDRATEKG